MTIEERDVELSAVARAALDRDRYELLAAIADHLIPAAHGMPSAGEVVDERRLDFVLRARPDLLEPLRRALAPAAREASATSRASADPAERLAELARDDQAALDAVLLTIAGGYYTDRRVRELIGYPGQQAKPVNAAAYPEFLAEGLIDGVRARGPVWRDPATGKRAESRRRAEPGTPEPGES